MNRDRIEYLHRLAPSPPHWQGRGALPLHPDPRDHRLRDRPAVAAQLAAGVPDSASLLRWVTGPPYNQGATGACVAASTCGACSVDTAKNQGRWDVFNWQALYQEAGGTGQNGVDSRLVLSICQGEGTQLAAGGREKVVTGYAFVTQQPGPFREEIKACIAAGYPAVIALLLPSDFGWQSGHGAVTSGYHQVCAVAFDSQYVTLLNSWGAGFGHNGLGSILWDYLEADGMQHSYCFAYSTTSDAAPAPPPPPPVPVPPPPALTRIAGDASGSGTLVAGTSLGLSGAFTGQLAVAEVGPSPTPTPTPIPTPIPTPTPVPTPTPPGDLTVTVLAKRHGATDVAIWATATGADGHFVTGTAAGIAGSNVLPAHALDARGDLTVWIVPLSTGSDIIVNVTAADGRTGSGHLMAP